MPKDRRLAEIGERLRITREALGLTQVTFCKADGDQPEAPSISMKKGGTGPFVDHPGWIYRLDVVVVCKLGWQRQSRSGMLRARSRNPRIQARYKVWRSNKDKRLHVLCAEGAEAFEALPAAVRDMGPWTAGPAGVIDRRSQRSMPMWRNWSWK